MSSCFIIDKNIPERMDEGDVRSGIFRIDMIKFKERGLEGSNSIFFSVNIFLFTVMSIGEKNKQNMNAM